MVAAVNPVLTLLPSPLRDTSEEDVQFSVFSGPGTVDPDTGVFTSLTPREAMVEGNDVPNAWGSTPVQVIPSR